ncbi:hypothetical protein E3U55_09950 [Filobacillus milosensis]|uniref:Regulatory protein YycH domain-containing protein n=1 Tax=Filobacillus milosensis TaxID=94137 RepID=A0A4Y8IMK8_9BACI|nr:two-component system activity regulator YycH [Filobacillus milosensis]TFB21132.1 hypothetical protein E3U55_09950 [Filobacillus milosensis]
MVEHIKSIILFLLVAFSLLLTFALWTYQPEFQDLDTQKFVDETKLEGQEKLIEEVVYPNKIIFHDYQEHKMFREKVNENDLYNEILSWEFSSIRTPANLNTIRRHLEWSEPLGWTNNKSYQSIEIQYPVGVPFELVNQMFSVNKNDVNWSGEFNKLYLNMKSNDQEIQFVFASDSHQKILTGEIESSKAFQRLENEFNSSNTMVNLQEYRLNNDHTVYLPEEKLSLRSYAVTTEPLSEQPMINVLFKSPSSVRRVATNNSDSYWTDGSRRLVTQPVFDNDEVMSFVNSLYKDGPLMNKEDMIQKSIEFTNDHTGWTDDFRLDNLNEFGLLNYRMYYNGYPIYDTSQQFEQLLQMEQKWINNHLYSLKRPLFKINNNIGIDRRDLASGENVYQLIQTINEQLSYIIQDVRIGYKLNARNDGSIVVLELDPEWHVKFGEDIWRPLSSFNDVLTNQGVE